MRCPKCQYISFDSGDRCRNCGYQLSFAEDSKSSHVDLPILTGNEPEGPLADLTLGERLPLFGDGGPLPADQARTNDDRPMVSPRVVPRAPLAVRKPAPAGRPAASAVRTAPHRDLLPEEPVLDLEPPDEPKPAVLRAVIDRERPPEVDRELDPEVDDDRAEPAPAGRRLLAALTDLLVIGSIDVVVLHFTLAICDLSYGEIGVLPVAPFVAFLLLLNGGYFVAFTTAGGQSIGKMLAGVKVVPLHDMSGMDRVPLGQAVLRAVGYLVSALPAGLGFLPALVGGDKRAIHDRLAHTRVVKV